MENIKYSDAMLEIEEILRALENNSMDVDKLTERVKRASMLISYCKNVLKNTESEVEQLLK